MNPTQNLSDVLGRIERQLKAPVVQRDKWERKLYAEIRASFGAQSDEIIRQLGNPPNPNNINAAIWEKYGGDLRKKITGILEMIFAAQVAAVIEDVGIAVDWGLANMAAANWASTYGFDLVRGITDTSRKAFQQIIGDFYRDGLDLGEIESRINALIFNQRRAEMIAITETTRAAVEGERAYMETIKKEYGLNLIAIWQTANDDRVCDICGPRHDTEIEDDFYPPAHVNCRCWITHKVKNG